MSIKCRVTTYFFYISATSMSNSMDILAREVVAYHFCQMDNEPSCIIPYFIHSVSAQLCQSPNLVAYRRLIANDSKLKDLLSIKSCLEKPDEAFVKGMITSLAANAMIFYVHIMLQNDIFF